MQTSIEEASSATRLISTAYPEGSKYVEVLGSKMHYLEQGEGEPILFIHGIPTHCYLWRNVMPTLAAKHRCIAIDLIGMGRSDKPAIQYSIFDHIQYLEGFIEKLNLQNTVLMMHAWGSAIGFAYAAQHPDRVKGLIFIEAYLAPPDDFEQLSLPMQELLALKRLPDGGYDMTMYSNYFVQRALQRSMLRQLQPIELQHYAEPFKKPTDCQPLWQYLQDIPLDARPTPVRYLMRDYSTWLQQTTIPKLMMYSIPGFNTTVETLQWARAHLSNLTQKDLGEDLHCPQETRPQQVAQLIEDWYALNFCAP